MIYVVGHHPHVVGFSRFCVKIRPNLYRQEDISHENRKGYKEIDKNFSIGLNTVGFFRDTVHRIRLKLYVVFSPITFVLKMHDFHKIEPLY